MIVKHGILCRIGFLGILPLGMLIARWTRTFTTLVRGALGCTGCDQSSAGQSSWRALRWGVNAVDESEAMHLDDTYRARSARLPSHSPSLSSFRFLFRFCAAHQSNTVFYCILETRHRALHHLPRPATHGSIIYFFKSKATTRRPAQNNAYASPGLLVITLTYWQARKMYMYEYPEWTTSQVPRGSEYTVGRVGRVHPSGIFRRTGVGIEAV